jgi:hypothetical protein
VIEVLPLSSIKQEEWLNPHPERIVLIGASNNYFAGVLGFPQGNVSATAAAGCFAPCGGTGVLPIAWSCRPPIGGFGGSLDCSVLYGDGTPPDPTYVIMDSQSLNTVSIAGIFPIPVRRGPGLRFE